MLSLNKISIGFYDRTLFRDVSFVVSLNDRIGLVGCNGAGKTTLLKIITEIQLPDSGSIEKAHFVTTGYLPQDGVIISTKSLYDEAEGVFEDILTLERKIAEAQNALSSFDPESPDHEEILKICGDLQHKLEDCDAFRLQSKIERVLMGLGFSVQDFKRNVTEFSGGWLMRIALAKLLLREPSLLLLDEPTNHLDLDSLQWLEEYLGQYPGAVIIVSHDRAFLDKLIKRTIAIERGKLEIYPGNYSYYEKQDKLHHLQLERAYKNQQKQLNQTQRFIDRFRYKATKARQVQSRIKQLEKMEMISLDEEDSHIHFHFPPPPPSGAVVIELKNVHKKYGNIAVFEKLNCTIDRGDRIAVVGVNGAGKSTFASILAGIEEMNDGERKTGHNLILSYFAQHQAEELDYTKEAIQILDEVAVGDIRTKLRSLLGAFLFHGDDIHKKVSVLSGGEKSRLALAKMLLMPANFLIMDEPTNHLDARSKDVLQQALLTYEGSFVIVSHDRAFLDPLVNKVFEFRDGGLRTHIGTMQEFLEKRKNERQFSVQEINPIQGQISVKPPGQSAEKIRKRIEAEKRQELYKKLLPLRQLLKSIEAKISEKELRKTEIETLMRSTDFYKNGDKAKIISKEYSDLKIELEHALAEWSEISEKIEQIQSDKK
jgi:ATP-binding cassette subfamily F protein 3